MIEAYNEGLPGVLNADDMGLGKTLQALVFLALYRQQSLSNKKLPCLIVAPTGLLYNWLAEISLHLDESGLGLVLKAFGKDLKDPKRGVSGTDIDRGIPLLDTKKMSQVDIVLTTYESLRDYHHSIARVKFGVAVFDEIQKVKNPRALMTRAAKAINSKFQIGLSGTPVENSLADLWTIFDVLSPGLLCSCKDFWINTMGL